MKKRITKRDVIFFLSGLITMLLIELIWDWNNNVAAIKKGFHDGLNNVNQETSK